MPIRYHDYLISSCNEQIMASKAITSPRTITSPENLVFKFSILMNLDSLDKQAATFRSLLTSKTGYLETINKHINVPFSERDSVIEKTYKYSFLKVIHCIRKFQESGFNYYGNIPVNSLSFYGHKELLMLFLLHNVYTPSRSQMENVSMTKILEYDLRNNDIMEEMDIWSESYSPGYPGGIFNPTYERILEAMNKIPEIQVSILTDQTDFDRDGKFNPLGNMSINSKEQPIFGPMETTIASVRLMRSITDTDSKFWNLACFINLEETDPLFKNVETGSPFVYVTTKLEAFETIFAKVKSITGISIDYNYTDFGVTVVNFGRNLGSPDPITPIGGNPYGPRFDNNGGSSTNFKQINNGNNNGPNNKSGQINKMTKALTNYGKTLGRSLTSEEAVAFLSTTASQIIDYRLRRNQINQIVNTAKSNQVVVDNNNFKAGFGPAQVTKDSSNLYIQDLE